MWKNNIVWQPGESPGARLVDVPDAAAAAAACDFPVWDVCSSVRRTGCAPRVSTAITHKNDVTTAQKRGAQITDILLLTPPSVPRARPRGSNSNESDYVNQASFEEWHRLSIAVSLTDGYHMEIGCSFLGTKNNVIDLTKIIRFEVHGFLAKHSTINMPFPRGGNLDNQAALPLWPGVPAIRSSIDRAAGQGVRTETL